MRKELHRGSDGHLHLANFANALVSALIGYLIFEYLRKKL